MIDTITIRKKNGSKISVPLKFKVIDHV